MVQWLEHEPPDRMVSGSGSATVMLFPRKRVSAFLWTSFAHITPIGWLIPTNVSVCVKYIVVFIQFTTVLTWYSVDYSIVCVLYIQAKVHCTRSYRHIQPWLYLCSLTIMESVKPEKYCVSCIGNVQVMQLPIPILCLYLQILQYRRLFSCLYRYSAYIFNIGTYSDPYTSIGATLIII